MPQIIERMQGGAIASTHQQVQAGTQRPDAYQAQQQLQNATTESPPKTGEGAAQTPGQEKTPDAQRLEALARREKMLRREAQKIAQEKQQLAPLQQQLEAAKRENAQLRGWAQRFYRNPVEVLNEAGVPGDVITQGLLNQPSREAVSIRAIQHQLAQIQEQNKALETKVTESQQAQYDQAKNQIRSDARSLISSEAESYEAIAKQGDEAIDAVVELIEQTFEKEDRLMSVKEAADEVENFLIEEAIKLNSLKKVQSKLGQASTQSGQTQSTPPANQGQTTLSNRGLPAPAPKGRRTERERIAAAIQAFQSARTQ
jgi:DNA repair exonuclease SbcCD ATPase subunit